MKPADDAEQAALKAEWERMQGLGSTLRRQRFVATVAGSAIAGLGFLASVLLYVFWPLNKIPVVILVAPIALSLGPAWAVRNKLGPQGQFR